MPTFNIDWTSFGTISMPKPKKREERKWKAGEIVAFQGMMYRIVAEKHPYYEMVGKKKQATIAMWSELCEVNHGLKLVFSGNKIKMG